MPVRSVSETRTAETHQDQECELLDKNAQLNWLIFWSVALPSHRILGRQRQLHNLDLGLNKAMHVQ